jgi:hypothetical protein
LSLASKRAKASDLGFPAQVHGGETFSKFAGDTWVMKKGPTVNLYNRGTVEHVQRIWLLVEG